MAQPKLIRKLRHWKQQYDKNAVFICRRSFKWDDIVTEIGDEIPAGLFEMKAKLENFWEAEWIELAEFEEPEAVKAKAANKEPEQLIPEGVTIEGGKGAWVTITLPNGDVVKKNGKKQIATFFADYTPPADEPKDEPEEKSEDETTDKPETETVTEETTETTDESDAEPKADD